MLIYVDRQELKIYVFSDVQPTFSFHTVNIHPKEELQQVIHMKKYINMKYIHMKN